jgi:hypothetical protein
LGAQQLQVSPWSGLGGKARSLLSAVQVQRLPKLPDAALLQELHRYFGACGQVVSCAV